MVHVRMSVTVHVGICVWVGERESARQRHTQTRDIAASDTNGALDRRQQHRLHKVPCNTDRHTVDITSSQINAATRGSRCISATSSGLLPARSVTATSSADWSNNTRTASSTPPRSPPSAHISSGSPCGVVPFTSPPASITRYSITGVLRRAVVNITPLAFTSAPAANSVVTTASCHLLAAAASGRSMVGPSPVLPGVFTLAPSLNAAATSA